jgi:hypothetical protein
VCSSDLAVWFLRESRAEDKAETSKMALSIVYNFKPDLFFLKNVWKKEKVSSSENKFFVFKAYML